MIRLIWMLVLTIPLGLQAQVNSIQQVLHGAGRSADRISKDKHRFIPDAEATVPVQSFIQSSRQELQRAGVTLGLTYVKESAYGKHFLYHQLYKGIPVYGAYLKVSVNHQHEIIQTADNLVDLQIAVIQPLKANATPLYLVLVNNQLIPVYRHNQELQDAQGAMIKEIDNRYYFGTDDTLVNGKVFNMDPLTSAGVIYGQGGTYKHFNDSDYTLLNNQRVNVTFPATLINDTFRLENKYVKIEDWAAPTAPVAFSVTPFFDYTRKQSGFKEVMAYYHALQTRQYFMQLGFTNRMQYQQRIDALSGGGDQSYFSLDDTTLNFGVGGVPDAEDGDVICHEFTHALSFDMSPTPDMFPERRAIEEGLCDLTSAIFSRKATPFNWRYLFNFDGPIPVASGSVTYWGGRNGQSGKTYLDKIGNPYKDCEIWTSCLLDIGSDIGLHTMMTLSLNSIYLMTQGTTMPQAAQLLLDVDSILYGGVHRQTMGKYFNQRKFGTFPESVATMFPLPIGFSLINTSGFARGESNAIVHLENRDEFRIRVYDMHGKVKVDWINLNSDYALNPEYYSSGMFILSIEHQGQVYNQKLIRF
ncbi:MAG: T9SS type A sorting domain-containing protein [Bacteroidia bacterium]